MISVIDVQRIRLTWSHLGCGAFPRQKLLRVQVAFRSIESLWFSLRSMRRGPSAPWSRTWSRHFGESPAMFPSAQTLLISHSAASLTFDSRLLTDIKHTGREEFDEEGNSVVRNNNLGVL
jgi:hypothetical protein